MTAPWKALEQIIDGIVDGQFAEPVEFYPWKGGQNVSDDADGFDLTRAVLKTTAVYVTPGAHATGEAGTIAGGLATHIVAGDEWISIQADKLGDPGIWVMYDRVYLPERGTWHSITSVTPSSTDRYNVNLVRVREPPL